MEPVDNQPEFSDDADAASPGTGAFGGRRKRVSSREVPAERADGPRRVADEMRAAAQGSLKPIDVINIPNLPPKAGLNEVLLDPTLLSERQRRSKQNYIFQITRVITVLVFLASCVAISLFLLEHRRWAQLIAGAACLSAAASIKLVRSSRLLYRLRGYVAAGCILSLLAFCITMWMPSFTETVRRTVPVPTSQPRYE